MLARSSSMNAVFFAGSYAETVSWDVANTDTDGGPAATTMYRERRVRSGCLRLWGTACCWRMACRALPIPPWRRLSCGRSCSPSGTYEQDFLSYCMCVSTLNVLLPPLVRFSQTRVFAEPAVFALSVQACVSQRPCWRHFLNVLQPLASIARMAVEAAASCVRYGDEYCYNVLMTVGWRHPTPPPLPPPNTHTHRTAHAACLPWSSHSASSTSPWAI